RGVHGHLFGEDAALGIAAVRLDGLLHLVDAFDDDLAVLGQHAQDPMDLVGAPGAVVPGADDHVVGFADEHAILRGLTPSGSPFVSNDFSREADDLHEVAVAEFAGHGAEDARAARILFRVDEHHGVAVEADVAAVGPAVGRLAADDHAFD